MRMKEPANKSNCIRVWRCQHRSTWQWIVWGNGGFVFCALSAMLHLAEEQTNFCWKTKLICQAHRRSLKHSTPPSNCIKYCVVRGYCHNHSKPKQGHRACAQNKNQLRLHSGGWKGMGRLNQKGMYTGDMVCLESTTAYPPTDPALISCGLLTQKSNLPCTRTSVKHVLHCWLCIGAVIYVNTGSYVCVYMRTGRPNSTMCTELL